jgi:CRISPR-associated protein Cas2
MPPLRFQYVVAYDVPDDKRRTRIAKALEGHGDRMQYSVFECRLTDAQFEALWEELRDLADAEADSLRAYRLCAACADGVKTYGQVDDAPTVPTVYVA